MNRCSGCNEQLVIFIKVWRGMRCIASALLQCSFDFDLWLGDLVHDTPCQPGMMKQKRNLGHALHKATALPNTVLVIPQIIQDLLRFS